jgi:hypothetical protein
MFASVKQIYAILLSVWISLISFFPKTDVCYLFDFGTLAEHYEEHRQNENIDFWQFLCLHYTHTEHQKQDQNHKKLPFHHQHAECVGSIILPVADFEINQKVFPIAQAKNYSAWQSFYCFQPTNENFQPPRQRQNA